MSRAYNLLTASEPVTPYVTAQLLEDLGGSAHLADGDLDPPSHSLPGFTRAALAELDHRSDRPGWHALPGEARRALLFGTYDTMVADHRRTRRRALALFGLWLTALTSSQMLLPNAKASPLWFCVVLFVRTVSTVLAGSALSNFLLLRIGNRVRLHGGFAGYRSFTTVTSKEQFEQLAERFLNDASSVPVLDELVPRVCLDGESGTAPGVRFARAWLETNPPADLPAPAVRNAVLFQAGLAQWVTDRVGEENLAVVLRLARRHPGTLADLLDLVRRL